jgi:putative flippase GtrA
VIVRIRALLRAHGDKLLFLVVGGINTVFSFALFAAFLWVADRFVPGIRENWVQVDIVLALSWVFAVTFSWGMFKLFVFRTRGTNWAREWLRSYLVYAPSLVMNLGALGALVGLLHLPPLVGQAIWAVFMAVYSYFGHKWFTFGSPKEQEPEPTTF